MMSSHPDAWSSSATRTVRPADCAGDDADLAITALGDPQLGVVTRPRFESCSVPGVGQVAHDIAVGVEYTHRRHITGGEASLAAGFPQQSVDLEHRQVVIGLWSKQRGRIVDHALDSLARLRRPRHR